VGRALRGHLQELRLPTVRQCYEETAGRAERLAGRLLRILRPAAEESEAPVDEALRELLERKAEAGGTAESIRKVLRRLERIAPVTEVAVEVAAVELASFDELGAETAVRP